MVSFDPFDSTFSSVDFANIVELSLYFDFTNAPAFDTTIENFHAIHAIPEPSAIIGLITVGTVILMLRRRLR